MSFKPFGARQPNPRVTGLEFGLRVRLRPTVTQRPLFTGAQNLSAQQLTTELTEMVASLPVDSYALRAQLEQVTIALQINVDGASWPYAQRAAYDLASPL